MSAPDRQAAFAALGEGRSTLTRLDRSRSSEDLAADIIDLWSSAEKALRSLAGVSTVSGQQLVRTARQADVITLDQAHALLEFLAARDRVNRTSYAPTPADSNAARDGFNAIEAAASGNPQPAAPAAVVAAPAAAGTAAAAYAPPVPRGNVPFENPGATPPGGYSVAATSGDRWRRVPLWARIGVPVLLLLLVAGGYFLFAGRNGAQSDIDAGVTAMQSGQREAARADFSRATVEDPDAAAPHIFLARLSREEGDLGTARQQIDEALRIEPGNAVALREMGLIMFASRNYEIARRFFVRAVQANPADLASQGYLGCALNRLKRTEEAMSFLNRAGPGAWSACAAPLPVQPAPRL